jgi:hypothetical protein
MDFFENFSIFIIYRTMKSIIENMLKTIEKILWLMRKQISENGENLIIEDRSNSDDISFKLQQKLKEERILVSYITFKDNEVIVRIKF